VFQKSNICRHKKVYPHAFVYQSFSRNREDMRICRTRQISIRFKAEIRCPASMASISAAGIPVRSASWVIVRSRWRRAEKRRCPMILRREWPLG
jgi:hypothetical protein